MESIFENRYFQVLIQWVMFFVLLAIIIVPAVAFRNIARRNKKKGWPFFLAGLGVGFTAIAVSRIVALLAVQVQVPRQYNLFFLALMLGVQVAIDIGAIVLFRKSMNG